MGGLIFYYLLCRLSFLFVCLLGEQVRAVEILGEIASKGEFDSVRMVDFWAVKIDYWFGIEKMKLGLKVDLQ